MKPTPPLGTGPPDRLRKRSGGPFGGPPGKSFEPKNLKSDEYMF